MLTLTTLAALSSASWVGRGLAARHRRRVIAVEGEAQSPMRFPGWAIERQNFAIEGEEHGEVPAEDMHPQSTLASHRLQQQIAQANRPSVGSGALRIAREERGLGMHIPSEDRDRALGLRDGGSQCAEIVRGIDEEGGPTGSLPPPAGIARVVPAVPLRRPSGRQAPWSPLFSRSVAAWRLSLFESAGCSSNGLSPAGVPCAQASLGPRFPGRSPSNAQLRACRRSETVPRHGHHRHGTSGGARFDAWVCLQIH